MSSSQSRVEIDRHSYVVAGGGEVVDVVPWAVGGRERFLRGRSEFYGGLVRGSAMYLRGGFGLVKSMQFAFARGPGVSL